MTTCPASTDPPSATKQELHNWSGALKFTPGTIFFPTTRGEIVRVIQQAENANQSVKVIGSVWSFTPLFEATDVVIDSTKITGPCDPRILDGLTFRDPSIRDSLCHLRGGTKVYNVNRTLHACQEDILGVGKSPSHQFGSGQPAEALDGGHLFR
jgi:FAD/FMN-containing dehydrogenase